MPLDSRSRVTCLTCHDTTDPSEVPSYLDVGLERFLRRPSGMEFCGGCHIRMGGTMSEQSHWRFSTRAHLGSQSAQGRPAEDFDQATDEIDTESRVCLTCHDDQTVTIPKANESPREKYERRQRMTNHPIGMTYEVTALQKRPGKYRFPLANESRVRLFSGRVGCGSCHSLYAKTEKNLVAPEEMGTLCRKCHKM
jgi:predicted CXXCH cytochrome family protein